MNRMNYTNLINHMNQTEIFSTDDRIKLSVLVIGSL